MCFDVGEACFCMRCGVRGECVVEARVIQSEVNVSRMGLCVSYDVRLSSIARFVQRALVDGLQRRQLGQLDVRRWRF